MNLHVTSMGAMTPAVLPGAMRGSQVLRLGEQLRAVLDRLTAPPDTKLDDLSEIVLARFPLICGILLAFLWSFVGSGSAVSAAPGLTVLPVAVAVFFCSRATPTVWSNTGCLAKAVKFTDLLLFGVLVVAIEPMSAVATQWSLASFELWWTLVWFCFVAPTAVECAMMYTQTIRSERS